MIEHTSPGQHTAAPATTVQGAQALALGTVLAALAALWWHTVSHTSADPRVLGRYSPPFALLAGAVSLALATGLVMAAWGWRRARAGRLPGWRWQPRPWAGAALIAALAVGFFAVRAALVRLSPGDEVFLARFLAYARLVVAGLMALVMTAHSPSRCTQDRRAAVLPFIAVLAFAVVLVRTAWLSDDAYITLRAVDNLVSGYGPVYNVSERVQTYTHPLWMGLLAAGYALFRNAYWITIALSVAVSLAMVWAVAFRLAADRAAGAAAVALLLASRAFVDYSTSGLENALSHSLLAVFLILYLRGGPVTQRRLLALSAVAGLAALNRLDLAVVYAPALLQAWTETRSWRGGLALIAGFAPLALWTLFSLFYYGAPFPNTAYAKLNTGVAAGALAASGLRYLVNSLTLDPVTLPLVGWGLTLPLLARDRRGAMVSAGMALYLVYIVRIGGDFMSGRFLSVPVVAAVVVIVTASGPRLAGRAGIAALAGLALALSAPSPHLLSGAGYASYALDFNTVADERGFWYECGGLLRVIGSGEPDCALVRRGLAWRQDGPGLVVEDVIGYQGFYAGPDVHVLDPLALADPLLARLPSSEPDPRPGHYRRSLPTGYEATLRTGRSLIEDRSLAAYYDRLSLVVRGDLLAPRRLRAIWELNTGQYDALLRAYLRAAD